LREILRHSNLDLLRELEQLGVIIRALTVPAELEVYHRWVLGECEAIRKAVVRNLGRLELRRDDILPEILSSTQAVTRDFHQFNRRLVSPVLRARESDRLSLKILQWLHFSHSRTRNIPAALSDGDFASWPVPPLPTIYFMPCSAQHGLLYLPIFFHEFGHVLYACHRDEMDQLVRELQEQIGELLLPSVVRGDLQAKREEEKRSIIVETWYEWAQELFCDAAGYTIGGPCFAYAFSMYLCMRGRSQFYVKEKELHRREHPVTWLRVQLLVDRARRQGKEEQARELELHWSTIADAMHVKEDYHGFYEPELRSVVQQTIADMLTEASPVGLENESSESSGTVDVSSPVPLLNEAWTRFHAAPQHYPEWERSAVASLLR
jgi:hypothetical protein